MKFDLETYDIITSPSLYSNVMTSIGSMFRKAKLKNILKNKTHQFDGFYFFFLSSRLFFIRSLTNSFISLSQSDVGKKEYPR